MTNRWLQVNLCGVDVYRRYAIVSPADLRAAAAKLGTVENPLADPIESW